MLRKNIIETKPVINCHYKLVEIWSDVKWSNDIEIRVEINAFQNKWKF